MQVLDAAGACGKNRHRSHEQCQLINPRSRQCQPIKRFIITRFSIGWRPLCQRQHEHRRAAYAEGCSMLEIQGSQGSDISNMLGNAGHMAEASQSSVAHLGLERFAIPLPLAVHLLFKSIVCCCCVWTMVPHAFLVGLLRFCLGFGACRDVGVYRSRIDANPK